LKNWFDAEREGYESVERSLRGQVGGHKSPGRGVKSLRKEDLKLSKETRMKNKKAPMEEWGGTEARGWKPNKKTKSRLREVKDGKGRKQGGWEAE
jgi:hypothetical protein